VNLIENDLRIIQVRLGEAWEAFVIERAINETANKDADPELNAQLARYGAFWQTVILSLQTTAILGIYSVLDRTRGTVTLYSVLREIRKLKTHPVLSAMEGQLDILQNRYGDYRNGLYGHNERTRLELIERFDLEGFTWEGMEKDFRELDYAWRVLKLANERKPIPSVDEAAHFSFGHENAIRMARTHALALLDELKKRPS
jgi:AbiU2